VHYRRTFAGFRLTAAGPLPTVPLTKGLVAGLVLGLLVFGFLSIAGVISTELFRALSLAAIASGAVAGFAVGRSGR